MKLFIRKSLGTLATVVAFGLVADLCVGMATEQAGKGDRSYVSAHFAFDLKGVQAGWLSKVEGGNATSDVVSEKVGPDAMVHKHITTPKYDDISVSFGTPMARSLFEWIKSSIEGRYQRNDGAIHTCDYDGNVESTLNFYHGLITEVGFPALDASSKDAAKMSIKIQPELTRRTKISGKQAISGAKGAKQKLWLANNFKVQIQGLNCSAVEAVNPLVFKLPAVQSGLNLSAALPAAHAEPPQLAIVIPESHDMNFILWQRASASNPKGGIPKKEGQVEFLGGNGQPVFTLKFHNLIPVSLSKLSSSGEAVRKVKCTMQADSVSFDFGSESWD